MVVRQVDEETGQRGAFRGDWPVTGSSFWRRLSGTAISLFLYFSITADPARATIRYEVSLIPPEQHLFHVSMQIPDVKDEVIVQLAAWNALYQIRDFSAHVQRVEAFAGADTLPIESSTNRPGASEVMERLRFVMRRSGMKVDRSRHNSMPTMLLLIRR